MLPELYRVRDVDAGWLAVMPRPRAGDWLEDEIRGLTHAGVSVIVSLLEASEVYELGLSEEESVCASLGVSFRSYPIPDRGIPPDFASLAALLADLREDLRRGHGVAVHCRAGIGRSGLVAGCVLVSAGVRPDDAFTEISAARGIVVPDTEVQMDWLHDNAPRLLGEVAR